MIVYPNILCKNAYLYRFSIRNDELTIFYPVIVSQTDYQKKVGDNSASLSYREKDKDRKIWHYATEGEVDFNGGYFRVWLKTRNDTKAKKLIKDEIDSYYTRCIDDLNKKLDNYVKLKNGVYSSLEFNWQNDGSVDSITSIDECKNRIN
jgi:hypothetical protein